MTAPLLTPIGSYAQAQRALDAVEELPARRVIELVRLAIAEATERSEDRPWLHLVHAIALAAVGESDGAMAEMDEALALYGQADVLRAEIRRDQRVNVWRRLANYHRGRLLLKRAIGDLTTTVSALASLQSAFDENDPDPRTCFHLATAIRRSTQRQTGAEAARLFGTYLDLGAPLGQIQEISTFLSAVGDPDRALGAPADQAATMR